MGIEQEDKRMFDNLESSFFWFFFGSFKVAWFFLLWILVLWTFLLIVFVFIIIIEKLIKINNLCTDQIHNSFFFAISKTICYIGNVSTAFLFNKFLSLISIDLNNFKFINPTDVPNDHQTFMVFLPFQCYCNLLPI